MHVSHAFRRIPAFILFFGTIFLSCAGAITERQWETLHKNVLEIELTPSKYAKSRKGKLPMAYGVDASPIVTEADLESIDALIQKDGKFNGINYDDKNRSVWGVVTHLDHCRTLAIGLHLFPESVLKKHRVRENCLLSLDWWLKHSPKNPNWWQNDVYADQMIGNIGLLLSKKDLAPRLEALARNLKKAKPDRTGQNLLWLSWNSLQAAIITKDEKRFISALDAMYKGIGIVPNGKEGIQPDMSFHQHGPQLYQGNYGRHYLHSGSKILRLTAGTHFYNPEKASVIEKFLLDGTRWMCTGQLLDYNVWGRQISYNDRPQGPDLLYVCLNMEGTKTKRRKEIQLFRETLTSFILPYSLKENSITGSKAFPYSDFFVHRDPLSRFMSSVKMSSTRLIVGEECNGDNLKGCYLSDGCLLTYVTGEEYMDIFPAWDWTCVPGTTAERNHLPDWRTWSGKKGGTPFAGALDSGVAGMSVNRLGLIANKSWFFINGKIICIGSNITKENTTGSVTTTIEQSLLNGKATVLKGNKVTALMHADTLYILPKESNYILETNSRRGTWSSIRSGSQGPDNVEKNVFLLALDHGLSPGNASYIYQVVPVPAANTSSPDEIWLNTRVLNHEKHVHAICNENVAHYVFFSPGSALLPSGKKISVEEACILTYNIKSGTITAMIPGKYNATLTVKVDTKTITVKSKTSLHSA